MAASSHARYSAWTGTWSTAVPDPDAVLDALADSLLSEGIDASLNRALHQGIDDENSGHLPGLDNVLGQIRAEQRDAQDGLLDALDGEALSDAAASAGDETLQRLLNALRAQSPAFPSLLSNASDGIRADLEQVLQSLSPGEDATVIADVLDRLIDLAHMERQLRQVRSVDDVQDIDRERLAGLVEGSIAEGFASLAEGLEQFADSGLVVKSGTRSHLSARAVQHIGDVLLQTALHRISSQQGGAHNRHDSRQGHEPSGTSRDYQFGDPFELDIGKSLLEAVKRQPGAPVSFDPRDLKVIEREGTERATTILAIDLSRSMGERGYLLAAKKLALALSTYIRRRFSNDDLHLIGFSEGARPILLQDLVDLQWDRFGYGTNMHDALRLANRMFAAHRGRKRNLIVITDGEPTAHRDSDGNVVFNHPPSDETLALTYREADRLRRDGIYLCVCLLSAIEEVGNFGRHLARHAAGDVLMTDPDDLSAELIVRYSARGR